MQAVTGVGLIAAVVGVLAVAEPALCQPAPPADVSAQPDSADAPGLERWLFADRLYYEPLLAEQRAARIFLLFPGWSEEFPHSVEAGNRFAWQITMGREIPIVGWQNERPVGLGRFSRGKWGFGLWTPIAFHMAEDFKDESAPIVDTDYRFGVMTKFQYGLTDNSWLSLRYVPWAHESTHLGDEYTIFASAQPDFERINVSYEYWEYGLSYERSFGRDSLLTLRHGGISLWGGDGYYTDRLLGETEPSLSVSEKNFEPSFGVEYRFPTRGGGGALPGGDEQTRQIIVSVDFRSRLQYSFHHPASGEEQRRPTWTIAVGRAAVEGNRAILRSYFGYFTHGVNPFGQLREQYPYWAAGIGWVFQ